MTASRLARLLGEPGRPTSTVSAEKGHGSAQGSGSAQGAAGYRRLADGVEALVTDGRLPVGSRMPSERELAAAVGLSRTTVTRAYDRLRAAGYLTSRQGSGSHTSLPAGTTRRLAGPLDPGDTRDGIDLSCAALPAPPGLAGVYAAALGDLAGYVDGSGYHPLGLPALRQAIAEGYERRGLSTDPDQIIVTSGAVAALATVVRAFAAPGARVAVETPCYPNLLAALTPPGVRPVGVTVDPHGWDPGFAATLTQLRPQLAVLVPDFHNPTGALMPDEERARVAAALRHLDCLPVVDETLVECALTSELAAGMPRPLAAHLRSVISVGGMSKSHWGGLRIGWLRTPARHLSRLMTARLGLDLGAALVEQLVACRLLAEGTSLDRDALRAGRDLVLAAVGRCLPDWKAATPPGGLSLWFELPVAGSSRLAAAAERRGVLLASGSRFAVDGTLERFTRIPFTLPPDVLDRAVRLLGSAWSEVLQGGDGRSICGLVA